MDHTYIDQRRIPEHYIKGDLGSTERAEFEAHLVDCCECSDRVLLAEMFHARNGHDALQPEEELPIHARIAARFPAWQIAVILGVAALMLLGFSTVIYLWELGRF